MERPLIGLTAAVRQDAPGVMRAATKDAYVRALYDAGGLPVLVLPAPADVLRGILERLDGLLLPGGVDVAPAHYGQAPHPSLGEVDAARDELELPLCRWALDTGKPVLGICRGMQVMNVAAGGTLYQDIPAQCPNTANHSPTGQPRDYIAHDVLVEPNTLLAEIVGVAPLPANSWHHQALRDVAAPFVVSARARDGIIEAIDGRGQRFAVGVQFHPEDLYEGEPRLRRLFSAFVAACAPGR